MNFSPFTHTHKHTQWNLAAEIEHDFYVPRIFVAPLDANVYKRMNQRTDKKVQIIQNIELLAFGHWGGRQDETKKYKK